MAEKEEGIEKGKDAEKSDAGTDEVVEAAEEKIPEPEEDIQVEKESPEEPEEGARLESESPEEAEEKTEISDEELRKKLEEQLEKITVLDVALDIMVTLSSLAYQKFGLPKEVNEKYRDLKQAQLAIDCLTALLDVCEPIAPEEKIAPLRGTLSNLKLLYIKESS